VRATRFGVMAAVWSEHRGAPRVLRILLPGARSSARQTVRRLYPDSTTASSAEIGALVDRIEAFLNGEDVRFPLDAVRLDLCSAFQRKVLRAEHAVPRGRVTTYGLLARKLGDANAARAVGHALATNPFPIIVPCHRAIRSDGTLGGFQGGLKMKRALLEMEGVAFGDNGRVTDQLSLGSGQLPFGSR